MCTILKLKLALSYKSDFKFKIQRLPNNTGCELARKIHNYYKKVATSPQKVATSPKKIVILNKVCSPLGHVKTVRISRFIKLVGPILEFTNTTKSGNIATKSGNIAKKNHNFKQNMFSIWATLG